MSLKELEDKSIFIIREAYSQFKNMSVLWSTGKDSTVILWLCKKAFWGEIPFPVIHIDTGCKFKEMYDFRDEVTESLKLNLIIAKNVDGISKTNSSISKFECCTARKTEALKKIIEEQNFDGIMVGIRRDEHNVRNKERIMSPRDKEFHWNIYKKIKTRLGIESSQEVELDGWNLLESEFGSNVNHVRVHPILHWNEEDVWKYIKQEKNIPVNPMYFANDGKRYRSLGCEPCTSPIDSDAKTIDEIVEELRTTKIAERSGRAQDKEDGEIMQRLRSLGYM